MLKKYFFTIFFILIIKIFISFQATLDFYNTNPQYIQNYQNYQNSQIPQIPFNPFTPERTLDSYKKLLLDIMHGKLPFKLETPSKIAYDVDFIERINGNFPFPYTLKSLDLDPKNSGIFLGAGINLLNFQPEEMDRILSNGFFSSQDKERIKSYCQISGENATNLIESENNTSLFSFDKIRRFNKAVIDYIVENRINAKFDNIHRFLKSPFINGFLSAFIQLPEINDDLKINLFKNYTASSYLIRFLFEGAPYARFIQSKLILMMDGNVRHNYNHIFFVIPNIFEENEKKNIKELIYKYSIYLGSNYNFNRVRISILIFDNENKKYLIYYNSNKLKSKSFEDLFNFNLNKTTKINFGDIYEYVSNLFEENISKKYFENTIITLFLNNGPRMMDFMNPNYADFKELNNIINNYKKKGIQTIPIINSPVFIKEEKANYNIFFDFKKAINIGPLKMAVSSMHINIDFTNKNTNESFKKIENLKLDDIDAPLYIEVNINAEKNESVFYEISLEIKETSGYNIFISDNHPYPNIQDYTIKFLKYEENFNPKLRMKANSINQFYISIEGILYGNLTIEKKYNLGKKELIQSEGDYNEESYNVSIYLKDETLNNLDTFTSNYRPQSYFLNNDLPLDSVLKYFTRGIELNNTDDGSFFNYKLFTYLFNDLYLINTVYKDPDNNNYYMGRYIELNQYTPFSLREEGFNRLFINKLYPFINGNNRTLINKDPPSVKFNRNELKVIYNITISGYVTYLNNLLNRSLNTVKFSELSSEEKFILLCLYFKNPKENIQIIKNLANREPKYPDILNTLKANKERDVSDKFIISFLSNFEQQIKFEKNLISVVVGKSFILSDVGVTFMKDFYNTMLKAKAKVSLLVYDTLKSKNKIKVMIPFYSKKLPKIELINEYKEKNAKDRYKYNNTDEQNMNFEKIIEFGLSYFDRYDTGIKKEIFIICDENLYTTDKYYINNNLTKTGFEKHEQLRKNQIKVILITTKNVETGNIPELLSPELNETKKFSIIENYFHVSNFENTSLFMNDLSRMVKNSIIKFNLGTRFINDFYHGKITFYEINRGPNSKDIIVIKANNLSNFNFYYSFENPFPNPYSDIKAEKTADNDKIVITDLKQNDRIYLGIESKNDVKKQIFEIFSCESYYSMDQYKNCKFVDSHRFLWYGLFLLIAIFIIGLAVYYLSHSILKTKINIFEQ